VPVSEVISRFHRWDLANCPTTTRIDPCDTSRRP
jgi:hypothetical protein